MAAKVTPDVLNVKCPQCGAGPGQKCKNYSGKGCAPHRLRQQLGDPQGQLMKKAILREDRERKAVLEEVPLFAQEALAEVKTAAENYWQARADGAKGLGDKDPYVGFTEDWQTILLKCLARRVLPSEVYAMACEQFTGLLASYPVTRWTDLLCSRRPIVLKRYRHVFGCTWSIPCQYYDGPPAIIEKRVEVGDMVVWPPDDWTPPLTPEQIKEFLAAPPPPEQPDDGGVAELVERALANSRRAAAGQEGEGM